MIRTTFLVALFCCRCPAVPRVGRGVRIHRRRRREGEPARRVLARQGAHVRHARLQRLPGAAARPQPAESLRADLEAAHSAGDATAEVTALCGGATVQGDECTLKLELVYYFLTRRYKLS